MGNEFNDKLEFFKTYCREHKYIYDQTAFIMLFNELKERNLIDSINNDFIQVLNLFAVKKNNIISLIRLLLIPEDFHDEDVFGFYYTFNYYYNYIDNEVFDPKVIDKISTVSPKFASIFYQLKAFDNSVPSTLWAKYGLVPKHLIVTFIAYNTYVLGKENINDLLLEIINNPDTILERLKVNGIGDYHHVNHDLILLNRYYVCLEIIFNNCFEDNNRIVR